MSTSARLTQVFKSSKEIPFNDSSKFVFFSDCHRGDGSWADDFAPNKNLYIHALNQYYNDGFTYIELGDGDELWENRRLTDITHMHGDVFKLLNKYYTENRLHMIWGNHDAVKKRNENTRKNTYRHYSLGKRKYRPLLKNMKTHEGLILKHTDTQLRIFVVHGHQGDLINDRLWLLGRFLVRYLWKPLEILGFNNPTSPAQNHTMKGNVERNVINWIKANNQMTIIGHTHRPIFPEISDAPYFNTGSCVHPDGITCIEIQNGEIALIRWCTRVRNSGNLYVAREILAGPRKISDFIQ